MPTVPDLSHLTALPEAAHSAFRKRFFHALHTIAALGKSGVLGGPARVDSLVADAILGIFDRPHAAEEQSDVLPVVLPQNPAVVPGVYRHDETLVIPPDAEEEKPP